MTRGDELLMEPTTIGTIEIGTIVAAVIAAICSIISTWCTWKGNKENISSNKELSKQVQDAENRRNEAQIDANIVWNARIEWIQNVRKITAEFITASYKYMHSDPDNKMEQNRNLELIQEKKSLLILCFGPDDFNQDNHKAKDISDKTTNNAKNEMIINLINRLFNQLDGYFVCKSELKSAQLALSECSACENVEGEKRYNCLKNEYDNFTEDDCKQAQSLYIESRDNCMSEIKDLFSNLNLLTEAMRIYIKIEWNYTKSRNK